ncbi:MAG: hypothetical protein FJ090_20605 [Deltaproteobacteria bacterium]|nr:hypothetical protein [Deltaproteobacteria bacterium]
MKPRINDGSRPSRLAIGRHRAKEIELPPEQAESAAAAAWNAEIDAAQPPPLDIAALRRRAEADPPDNLVPLFRRVVTYLGAAAAMAAAAVLAVRVPDGEPTNRTKGEVDLGFYVFRDGEAFPGDPSDAVRAGDQLQFTYHPAGFNQLVIVGIDGNGTAQVYFPDEDEAPLTVTPGERHVLEGSILLDDAPGPEIFVGFFDGTEPEEAARELRLAWNAGGRKAIEALDAERTDVAILVLDKD